MEMHAARTAMLILVGWICFPPVTHGTVSADDRATGVAAVTACEARLSTGWFVPSLPRATYFGQFTRWKARPKIVLGESKQNVVEEVDLGPAPVPDRLISSAPLPRALSAASATCRLRC
jgi:hypothetical protein